MYNYKIHIRYDGSRYKGWQRLGNSDKTVQGKVEAVLSKALETPIQITGASRTDAGVHARDQVAVFKTNEILECHTFLLKVNQHLPEDIEITELSPCKDRFHPRYNATGKIYVYQIWNGVKADPFERHYFTVVPQALDIERMKAAAQVFIGSHDFTTFTTAKAKKKSMVREIKRIDIKRADARVFIEIEGDGFLHNQVRRMVGVLIEIGAGSRQVGEIDKLIKAKDRSKCGVTAPPQGLFLERVLFN